MAFSVDAAGSTDQISALFEESDEVCVVALCGALIA